MTNAPKRNLKFEGRTLSDIWPVYYEPERTQRPSIKCDLGAEHRGGWTGEHNAYIEHSQSEKHFLVTIVDIRQ